MPRTNHACCTLGDKLYIHGGNVTMNIENDSSYNVLDDFWIFDTKSMTWSCPKTYGGSNIII
jgi:hypothetical protein